MNFAWLVPGMVDAVDGALSFDSECFTQFEIREIKIANLQLEEELALIREVVGPIILHEPMTFTGKKVNHGQLLAIRWITKQVIVVITSIELVSEHVVIAGFLKSLMN